MTSTRHIVVAINPAAGSSRRARDTGRLLTALGQNEWRVTECQAASYLELETQLRELLREGDTLVVAGGDGMVNLGVNVVHGTKIPLAVLPVGTGNDFVRGIGFRLAKKGDPVLQTIESLARGPRLLDVGRATWGDGSRLFVGAVSAGFDALVNERANRMRFPKGQSRYTWAIFRELMALRPRTYELTIDGQRLHRDAVLITIANNGIIGGGMWVAPQASLTDGLVDVFSVAPVSRRRLIRLLPTVFRGTHVREPEVSLQSANRVRIEADGIVAYADGERLGALPLDVETVPSAVWVHTLD